MKQPMACDTERTEGCLSLFPPAVCLRFAQTDSLRSTCFTDSSNATLIRLVYSTGSRECGSVILSIVILSINRPAARPSERKPARHPYVRKFDDLDPRIIDALLELGPEVTGDGSSSVPIAELTAGLILDEEGRTGSGLLIAAKGQEITAPLLLKLKTFAAKQHVPNELLVCPAKRP